ncbi:carboxypeptidase regulatory-like domain-containing protein, partial [bacterium]|nr:carboxypeptidase regulatory-like domain-containing protein [bacterium]
MSMFPLPTILKRILPLAAALALILAGGCTDQSVPSEPLPGQAADGAVLAGTVTDTGGARAADAVIVVEPLVAGVGLSVARSTAPDLAADRDPDKSGGVRTAVSDGQGRFALPELAAGAYVVTTTLRDHAGDSRTVTISAALADKADTTFVDIALTPTGTLAGVATLENAILHDGTVVYVEGTSYLAVTDGAGAYAMTGVPVGTWNVRAFHAGYLDDATTGSLAIAAEVDTLPDLFLPLESNIAPIVDQIDATPLAAGQPTAFVALAHDPDGTVVRWEWDFENDGVWDYDSALTGDTGFAYAVVGPVTAKLRVTDDGGAIGLGAISFEVPAVSYAGIFVATTGDDANTGAHDDPLLTIGAALGLANQQGATDIWVETGVYTEFVTLPAGLGVHGGRVPPTWDRGPGQYSRLTGDVLAAGALGVNQPTLIEGMEFVAVDATDPGQASVAMTVFACTSALVFDDCIFAAGNGADGADGTDGVFGPNGQNGGNGAPGACDNIISAPGGLEGGGGWAGGPGGSGGQGAAAGENGWASSAAPGGQGGASGNPGQAGQNGFNGPDGGNGFGGTAAAPYGSLS